MKKKMFTLSLLIIAAYFHPLTSVSAESSLLLKNGNIITISGETIKNGDILIRGTKIKAVGRDLKQPSGAKIIDLNGQWVMPGIIDTHSHIAVEGGVNEMGTLLSAEVDIANVLNPEDINIYYALAGGVTTVHTMHGSGNPIGGKNIVIKLRWGKSAEEMIFKDAPRTIKWALGENPKQSNSSSAKPRYPASRMGVEASIRKIFEEAREYKKKWDDYRKNKKRLRGKRNTILPPRKNYRLETISDVLDGKILVRCHAYQAAEMLSIMKLCKEYGIKLAAFEHGLEGYKIADELVKYGVAVTTFADFWGYKWEAFFSTPYATALMAKRGVLVALNSDSSERMRRLFLDAQKTVRFGHLSENEALKTITLNGAKILGVENRIGTIEVGKDADLAIFNRHPLDSYTICMMTIVDGTIYFDREQYKKVQEKRIKERKQELQKKKKAKKSPEKKAHKKKPESSKPQTEVS